MSLRRRLCFGLGASLAALGATLFFWLGSAIEDGARREAVVQLERAAAVARVALAGRIPSDALADSLGRASGLRFTLLSRDGRVLGDSELEARLLAELPALEDRPEIRGAVAGAPTAAERVSPTVSRAFLFVAVPDGERIIRVALPVEEIRQPAVRARRIVLASTLAGILLLIPAARVVAGPLERRLERTRAVVQGLRDGEPSGAGRRRRDSVSALAEAVDLMAAEVRERLASTERRTRDLQALFEGLDEGLAFVDHEGVLAFANPAFCRWAGRDVPVGTRAASVFRSPTVLDALERARHGETVSEEVRIRDRSLLLVVHPHRGGALVALRDLTSLRRLEGIRRDFVANVSHELRTPLTSIIGFAEALAGPDLPDGAAEDFGRRVLANAMRMRRLVDDLLDLAVVESGHWAPAASPVSPAAVARLCWSELTAARLAGTDVSLAVEDRCGARVEADPNAVRQIFANLLENAARYAPPGSDILVRVLEEGSGVRVEVTDRGPGIPAIHRERVFERFYRVDAGRSSQEGGTGLGLAIVKHLVSAHGGEVGIESAVGRGTTVWFTLPRSAGEPGSEDPVP